MASNEVVIKQSREIPVYTVAGVDYINDLPAAVTASLTLALGGYLTGSKTSIPLDRLAQALLEPGVLAKAKAILDSIEKAFP